MVPIAWGMHCWALFETHYQEVSFNNPPLGKNPPANIWLRFCKNKTPRPKFGGDAEKNLKFSREAREKKWVVGHIRRENVNKSQNFARSARKKSGFGPYTEGKREEKITNLRAKRAEKIGFFGRIQGKTLKKLLKNGRRRRPQILTKINPRTYKLAEILKNETPGPKKSSDFSLRGGLLKLTSW